MELSILLIEDNPANQEELRKAFLEVEPALEFEVKPDHVSGLRDADKKNYNLIFVDYEIAGEKADQEMVKKFREASRESYILLISSFPKKLIFEEQPALKEVPFLQKPFLDREIRQIVKLLEQHPFRTEDNAEAVRKKLGRILD
ncbi:MAG: response regulator [Candidatus Diapherotrites archaeon]